MKSKTTQFLIFIIIINVCVGAGYYFLFDHIKKQNENASVLQNKIDLSEQRNSRFNDLQSAVKDTEIERNQLTSLLLPSGSQVAFVEQVEDLTKSSGLSEQTNNLSEAVGPSDTTKLLQIQLTVTGSWSNTMYFLSQLENLPYNISIRNASLTEQTGVLAKEANLWTGVFDVSVIESL